jgi:hypothetical protein
MRISRGQQLFVSRGCAACHGPDAEGSGVAPALAGHTAEQVERQVRTPVGAMPAFPRDAVSEEELGEIIEFIASLEGDSTHTSGPVTADELAMHHWMALFAIEAASLPEALHHVDHIIDLTEGHHLARMQEARKLLGEGNTHEAEPIIEEMATGTESTGLDLTAMHLTMALSALRGDDSNGAIHHLGHFLEMADPDQLQDGERILALMHQGRTLDAEHQLEDFLGHMPAFGGAGHHDLMPSKPHGGHR